jgi:hypothetical protein
MAHPMTCELSAVHSGHLIYLFACRKPQSSVGDDRVPGGFDVAAHRL